MMPEGSRKVCVLNGSRQIDQVIKGEWTTLKVLPESGLSKGIYQLGEATKASSGKDASFTGQVLFSDSKAVYQLSGKGVVEHPRSAFAELEAKGEKIVDGAPTRWLTPTAGAWPPTRRRRTSPRRAPRRKGTVPRCDQRAANWPPFFR
ncbi:KfrB domain-containing protein [Halopseudomonas pachastrellae]|nr:KfrB domain-containing protein [Halopseudomonas pachastrellae]